jgi:hypothetical protein
MRKKALRNTFGALVGGMLLSGAVHAGFVEVTVTGTTGPWNWATGGLNSGFTYGPVAQNFTAPASVDLASIGSGVGQSLFILYKSGQVNPFVCCGGPFGPSGEDTSTFKDDVPGSTLTPFPSAYMPNQWGATVATDFNNDAGQNPNGLTADPNEFGVFLSALVATLTDSSGAIVGDPFAIGSVTPFATNPGDPANDSVGRAFGIGLSFTVTTAGATHLNLGINDDTFADNSGAFVVCVGSSQADIDACIRGPAQNVAEPGTLALLGLTLAALGALRRRAGS